jgi:hypothetical protein
MWRPKRRAPAAHFADGGLSYITNETFVLQNRDNPQLGIQGDRGYEHFDAGGLQGSRRSHASEAGRGGGHRPDSRRSEVGNALATEVTRDREPLLTRLSSKRQRWPWKDRYRVGSTDMRSVLQQQMALYSSRSGLLRIRRTST